MLVRFLADWVSETESSPNFGAQALNALMDPESPPRPDVPWEEGYWEIADAEGEHGPKPERLEAHYIGSVRCSLWMKLYLYFKDIGMEGYAYGEESYTEMTVREGWAKAYDSWVIFMTLMAASYYFPPTTSAST